MFSELVDSVISRSGRKDQLLSIVDYTNSTIRECQAVGLFFKDGVEDQIPLAVTDPLIWTPTDQIKHIRTVKYSDLSYPALRQPGRIQQHHEHYWYAAGNYYVFVGSSGPHFADAFNPQFVYLYYYIYQRRLKYYPIGSRPATWDDEAELWTYYNLFGVPGLSPTIAIDWTNPLNQPPNDPNALTFVTNWLLEDWNEMIKEGALAKLYKNLGDTTRANSSFAFYMEMRKLFASTELQEGLEK